MHCIAISIGNYVTGLPVKSPIELPKELPKALSIDYQKNCLYIYL